MAEYHFHDFAIPKGIKIYKKRWYCEKDTLNIGLVGYKFMGKAHSNAFQKVSMFFEPSVNICMKAICEEMKLG